MFHFITKSTLIAAFGCSLLLFTSACAYREAAHNRENMNRVRIGMSKEEVKNVMGEPLKESFATDDIWYYYVRPEWIDGMATRDECTPFIFDEYGRLSGFGKDSYRSTYRLEHWSQKSIRGSIQLIPSSDEETSGGKTSADDKRN